MCTDKDEKIQELEKRIQELEKINKELKETKFVIKPEGELLEMVYSNFSSLLSFIDFLKLDNSISTELANEMTNKLLIFKTYAISCDEFCFISEGWTPPPDDWTPSI